MSSNILGNVTKYSGKCPQTFRGMSPNIPENVTKYSEKCPQTFRVMSPNIPGNVAKHSRECCHIPGNVATHSGESSRRFLKSLNFDSFCEIMLVFLSNFAVKLMSKSFEEKIFYAITYKLIFTA